RPSRPRHFRMQRVHRKSGRGSCLGADGGPDGALPSHSRRGHAQPPTGGSAPPLELALEVVVGFMLQALSAFAEKRVSRDDREPALVALLRALGADGRRIRTTMARLPKPPVSEA